MSRRPATSPDAAALLKTLSEEERERLVKVLAQLFLEDEEERASLKKKRSMT